MAMVNCKECGKSVSDAALLCPNCGIAAPALTAEQKQQVVQFSAFVRSRVWAGALIFGGIGWLVLSAQIGGRDAFVLAWDTAKWMIGGGALWYVIAEIDRNFALRKLKQSELK